MAKILVADDNSNIQKMVGLALKDQGIDVVAVGNGEAAVRKIADVRPDLVLADVFMPVRNGYEVCQYVKSDSSLAHIPVILLVGAFDPLDEQEAQRVGADGVLKKPFVPPDPLISMVKSALARAGVQVGAAAPAPRVREEPARVAEMIAPRPASAASGLSSMSSPASVPEIPSVESEPLMEGTRGGPEPVRIAAGSQPLAFGNLLETPEGESEEELGLATTARPELERDWKSRDEEEEEVAQDEEEEQSASWRRDAGAEELEAEEAATGPVKDWRETAFAEAPARHTKQESWTPQKEVSGFEEAAEVEQSVSAMVKEAPVAETTSAPAAVTPFTQDAWTASLSPKAGVEAATMEAPAPLEPVEAAEEPAAPTASVEGLVSAPAKTESAPEPPKPAAESSWYSVASSPWDAEAQKANRLASTWDVPAKSEPDLIATQEREETPAQSGAYAAVEEEVVREVVAKEDSAPSAAALTPSFGDALKTKVEEAALPAATVIAIREGAQQVAETVAQAAPAAEASPKTPEAGMEDLVAKVLSKMSPEMLQAVTREILKPVVEAMVRDELQSKK